MKWRLIAVLAVAAIVVLASGLTVWWAFDHHQGRTSSSRTDGPTLYEAIAEVNRSLTNTSEGPWGLFSVFGIAAQAPFSANVLGYGLGVNETVNACESQFNGLTIWNGTMPVFGGSFNSGTAPYWQFAYYSNSTHDILLVADVLGVVHVFPPMQSNGTCSPWFDLGNPEKWVLLLSSFPADSTVDTQSALSALDQTWLSQQTPEVEILTSGPGMFSGYGDVGGGIDVDFQRCGLVGITGVQPVIQVGESLNGVRTSIANGTSNCALLNHPYFAGYGSYDLVFASANVSSSGETTQVDLEFQVAMRPHNSSSPTSYDGWGLANWMTSWNLTTPSDSRLPLGMPACTSWVPSVDDCVANTSGWYAVVLSASGEWINSYGALPNGTAGWSEPVTALVSHQQLVIVAPSSWALAGDKLTVNSTVSTSTVIGSLAL
jgi:hypothetical protein